VLIYSLDHLVERKTPEMNAHVLRGADCCQYRIGIFTVIFTMRC